MITAEERFFVQNQAAHDGWEATCWAMLERAKVAETAALNLHAFESRVTEAISQARRAHLRAALECSDALKLLRHNAGGG
jgi:hypothetical protein